MPQYLIQIRPKFNDLLVAVEAPSKRAARKQATEYAERHRIYKALLKYFDCDLAVFCSEFENTSGIRRWPPNGYILLPEEIKQEQA